MTSTLPRIIISSGEPAGIGPDLCLMIAAQPLSARIVVVADPQLLAERAAALNLAITLNELNTNELSNPPPHQPGTLQVLPIALNTSCQPGVLCAANSQYVIDMLRLCVTTCMEGNADAMVTAPAHKGIINDAGISFSGHTELLADLTGAILPVMLLCIDELRVALATTHMPLSAVSRNLTKPGLQKTIRVLREGLQKRFHIKEPRISVCGLNPHAGESGHLGTEEIDIIEPVLANLRSQHGWTLHGPLPADTVFTPRHLQQCDAVLAMFHDQGLPVLKYAGFGRAVNVTLGLPIVRTSVDHGTALDLAGTGQCDSGSMMAALSMAMSAAS